jgi:hypothetical protein
VASFDGLGRYRRCDQPGSSPAGRSSRRRGIEIWCIRFTAASAWPPVEPLPSAL